MKKNSAIKAAGASYPIPQNAEQADDFIAAIGQAQRERESIETLMNEALAAIKKDHERIAAPYKEKIEVLSRGLQTWCEAHRAEITQGGKVKFHIFAAGEVLWRLRPPSVVVKKVAAVLRNLPKLGLERFIRVKKEIDKEAMLADPEAASRVPGVTIKSGLEDFVIRPFESSLEQVAAPPAKEVA